MFSHRYRVGLGSNQDMHALPMCCLNIDSVSAYSMPRNYLQLWCTSDHLRGYAAGPDQYPLNLCTHFLKVDSFCAETTNHLMALTKKIYSFTMNGIINIYDTVFLRRHRYLPAVQFVLRNDLGKPTPDSVARTSKEAKIASGQAIPQAWLARPTMASRPPGTRPFPAPAASGVLRIRATISCTRISNVLAPMKASTSIAIHVWEAFTGASSSKRFTSWPKAPPLNAPVSTSIIKARPYPL